MQTDKLELNIAYCYHGTTKEICARCFLSPIAKRFVRLLHARFFGLYFYSVALSSCYCSVSLLIRLMKIIHSDPGCTFASDQLLWYHCVRDLFICLYKPRTVLLNLS